MNRRLRSYAKNDYGQRVCNPDVRPLDQREKILNTRKGMIKLNSETSTNVTQLTIEVSQAKN